MARVLQLLLVLNPQKISQQWRPDLPWWHHVDPDSMSTIKKKQKLKKKKKKNFPNQKILLLLCLKTFKHVRTLECDSFRGIISYPNVKDFQTRSYLGMRLFSGYNSYPNVKRTREQYWIRSEKSRLLSFCIFTIHEISHFWKWLSFPPKTSC